MQSEEKFIEQLKKAGLLTPEGQINFKNYSLDHPVRDIKSSDPHKFSHAAYILCQMINVGREAAMRVLFDAFKENKHDFKRLELIAERLEVIDNDEYIDFIFDFLENTKSSNKSSRFIKSLIRFFTRYDNHPKVIERLERLTKNKNFSYRMRRHFKNAKADVLGEKPFSFYD